MILDDTIVDEMNKPLDTDAEPTQDKEKEQATDSCSTEITALKESCLRIAADFENYKKRVERDRASWTQMAQSDVILALLPIVDDFDRALEAHRKQEHSEELNTWLAGFELINKALYKFLTTHNVTEIVQIIQFDPEFHEAIAQVESPVHEAGQIVSVVQKGYMHKDQVLRPARVTVAK